MKCFILFLFLSIQFCYSQQSNYFYINNSILHIHSKDAAGIALDHEIGFCREYSIVNEAYCNDIQVFRQKIILISISPSIEYAYYADKNKTTNIGFGNINIQFTKSITDNFAIYNVNSFNIVNIFPKDFGIGYGIGIGTSLTISNNSAAFIQVKKYSLSTETYLGRLLTQIGLFYHL